MSAQDQPYINRALRTINTELNFLADTGALRRSELDQILSLLPPESQSHPASRAPSAAPAQSATPAAPAVHSHFSPPFSPPASAKTPLSEKILQPSAAPLAPPPTYTPTALVVSRAEALWAFPGSEPGDLAFNSGDTIEVVEKVKDDWWRGRIAGGNGEIGLFPSSYVRETQQLADSKLPNLPPRASYGSQKSSYGPGGNMMTEVAHGNPPPAQSVGDMQQHGGPEKEKKPMLGKNGEKFGKKLGNAAIFGAGATIGGKIVNGIF